jgi:hypothetical protein
MQTDPVVTETMFRWVVLMLVLCGLIGFGGEIKEWIRRIRRIRK